MRYLLLNILKNYNILKVNPLFDLTCLIRNAAQQMNILVNEFQ